MMKKTGQYISYFLKIGTLTSTAALVLSVLIQIYGRFFMDNAPVWTEEASRILFIYSISFAAGLAYKQNYFIFLDLISPHLSIKNNVLLEVAINTMTFILFLIIAIFSIQFIKLGMAETSPSLGINMAFSFVSILLMSASICFYSGIKAFQLIRKLL